MPLDPCSDGCLNHNIGAAEGPVAGDDPCNSAGNGYFCQGSYWLYDSAVGGADIATWGDCPRLWIRSGGDCNVDQWTEIALAGLIIDTVAPVDGTDCCPPGSLWCVPAAGAVTEDQLWISGNGCGATDCGWCKLCGYPRLSVGFNEAQPGPGTITLPEGVVQAIPHTQLNADNFDALTGPATGTWAAPEDGCYLIYGWAALTYTDVNFDSSILRLETIINGGNGPFLDQVGGYSLNRPFPDPITLLTQGSTYICMTAGTTVQMGVSWNTNAGGTTIDLNLADFKIIGVKV